MDAQKPLHVELAERAYPIHFGGAPAILLRQYLQEALDEQRPVTAVVDAQVATDQHDWLQSTLPAGVSRWSPAQAGEAAKCSTTLDECYAFLAQSRVDRSGLLVAVGGGVIGDLAGYAAATWLRGIDFVQVPTTLLAMVDSSVGGKTGINTPAGKNLVGAFHQPRAVFMSMGLLSSLPQRELAAGMAEVIKYGLLADDSLFREIETLGKAMTWDHPALPAIVRRCCAIKADIVRQDERETAMNGGRALLNLGHTFGHAIEKVAGFGVYLHGEAVSVGMLLAARLSAKLGMLPEGEVARIQQVLETQVLPTALRQPLPMEALMKAMLQDKKVRQGQLRLVLMEALGRAVTVNDVDAGAIEAVWETAGAA